MQKRFMEFSLLDLQDTIRVLSTIFDTIMVVNPIWKNSYDASKTHIIEKQLPCTNDCPLHNDTEGCICEDALSLNKIKSRFTFTKSKAYYVTSKPFTIRGNSYCLVMIQELDKDFAFGSHKDADAAKAISDISSSINIDTLTQIYNRKYYNENINFLVQESLDKRTPLSLAQIDIDNFKQFNDKYGHECGDVVLKTVADNMQKVLKDFPDSFNARMGGDEFLVVGVGLSRVKFKNLMQQLCFNISSTVIRYKGQSVRIGCSIGIAEVLEYKLSNAVELYNKADEQLYVAKSKGKGTVC